MYICVYVAEKWRYPWMSEEISSSDIGAWNQIPVFGKSSLHLLLTGKQYPLGPEILTLKSESDNSTPESDNSTPKYTCTVLQLLYIFCL